MNGQLHRPITDEEIATYRRDGIVCLRGFFDSDWVEHLREQVDADMAKPSPMRKNVDEKKGEKGFFFGTFMSRPMAGWCKSDDICSCQWVEGSALWTGMCCEG